MSLLGHVETWRQRRQIEIGMQRLRAIGQDIAQRERVIAARRDDGVRRAAALHAELDTIPITERMPKIAAMMTELTQISFEEQAIELERRHYLEQLGVLEACLPTPQRDLHLVVKGTAA